MKFSLSLPTWTLLSPVLAWIAYFTMGGRTGTLPVVILCFVLIAGVLAAVHHAEVVAHRVGEPFGTIILALAVTVIEVSLIVSLMSSGGEKAAALARDTVFAAIMIILTFIIGICILIGGAKFREQFVTKHAATSALVALTAILVLTLVVPNYTTSQPGPQYTQPQLVFIAVVSLIIYSSFIMIQSVRHRDYFLPKDENGNPGEEEDLHALPPTVKTTIVSLILLITCLGAVVLLAKMLSPFIETGVAAIGAPNSLVGIIIAMVVLLPECIAAIQAARKNRLQTSMNLALGSALASIGLTIPAVAIYTLFSRTPVLLGIDTTSTVLLILSIFTVMLSLVTGKTNVLYGVVLLTIFATYLFLTIFP
ncbi:ionic transporter y4hA [Niabella ginsenosidivorans]|uniref:Ionic transporter y4hA n=1 Tax=Niabella ginsenosidivorans TaxID=1176587 RepID=A0A1A9HXR8_9BACT|nr:ionic transporter y4hA [Niabella ginsenosidivorans]ANH80177.1 ionic transporter y4hA [Niabella ginsenosidivorans]